MKFRIVLISLCVLCSGCIGLGERARRALSGSGEPPPVAVAESDASATLTPVTTRVLEEVMAGDQLMVMAALRVGRPIRTEDVVVSIKSFREGEPIASRSFPLRTLVSVPLLTPEKGDTVVSLSVPAAGGTDYQIEVEWGSEARARLQDSSNVGGSGGGGVAIVSLRTERESMPCDSGDRCGSSARVVVEVANRQAAPVRKIVLGVDVVWLPTGARIEDVAASARFTERVEVAGVALNPGASKRIRVRISRVLPDREGGVFEPVVKVLSYE